MFHELGNREDERCFPPLPLAPPARRPMVRANNHGDFTTLSKGAASLAKARARIDGIDTEILRLIDQRMQLSRDVAAAKREAGESGFGLRPARESQIIRRLIEADRDAATRGLVVRVWRELMAESLYQQSPFHISAWGGREASRVQELARMRFGAAPALYRVDEPEQALAGARLGAVGVLALSRDYAWWARLLVEPKIKVFAVLPCMSQWGEPAALAVAAVELEPSGPGDETLWVTDAKGSAWEIENTLSRDGMAARLLCEAGGLKLFALAGFYQANDERLARAPGRLTGVIGVAPAPFDM